MKKSICAILAVMIMMLAIAPAFAISIRGVGVGMTLYVKTSGGNLNMREAANSKATIIYKLPYGTPVTAMEGYDNGYLQVKYSVGSVHKVGWVDIKFLDANKPSSKPTAKPTSQPEQKETVASLNFRSFKLIPADTTYIVSSKPSRNGGFVNLRWVPSLDSAIIERMYLGEEMTVIAEGQKWLQVQCADGWIGFIVKSFTNVVYRGDTATYEAKLAAAQ